MKKNLTLYIGILLPLVFIGVLSIVVWFSTKDVNPTYSFLYYGPSYGMVHIYEPNGTRTIPEYTVESGRIETLPRNFDTTQTSYMPAIFLYDIQTNTSREISFTEARALTLSGAGMSPDGYEVQYAYRNNGGFFPFWSGDTQSLVIAKGDNQKALPGVQYYDFRFIGWVISQ